MTLSNSSIVGFIKGVAGHPMAKQWRWLCQRGVKPREYFRSSWIFWIRAICQEVFPTAKMHFVICSAQWFIYHWSLFHIGTNLILDTKLFDLYEWTQFESLLDPRICITLQYANGFIPSNSSDHDLNCGSNSSPPQFKWLSQSLTVVLKFIHLFNHFWPLGDPPFTNSPSRHATISFSSPSQPI